MKQKLYFFLLLVLTQLNVFSQSGTHLNFDGVNDYVALANDFNLTDNFTFEAWIKTGVDGIIIHNDNDYDRSDFKIKNGKLTYETARLGYGGYILASNTTVSDNTWHHVAITMNLTTANNVCKLYIDGVLEASHTFTIYSVSYSVPIGSLIIGSYQYSPSFFNGDIDEVRIWSVIRTASEINGSKSTEIQCNQTGLVGYYQFNKGINAATNTNLINFSDVSGNGHNGILGNFALAGTTSNWLSGSPIVSLSSPPIVVSPVNYDVNDTAVALTATPGLNGTSLLWYTNEVGGVGTTTLIPSTTTPGSTTYYVSSVNDNGCQSERTALVVKNTLAVPEAISPQIYAGSATIANLTATLTNLRWYSSSTGGTELLPTTTLVDGSTYYVAHSSGNAESIRAAVKVRKISTASQTHCNGATIANLVVTPTSGSTANWFSAETGGTALLGTSLLSSGNYYVEQTGTETSNRVVVPITIEVVSESTVSTPVNYYKGATATALTATIGTNGTSLVWYTIASGGTGSATTPTPNTATVGTTSYWVSSKNNNGCESARTEIMVNVAELPAPTVKNPQVYSGSATISNLTASGTSLNWYAASTGGAALLSTTVLVDGITYYVGSSSGTAVSSRSAVKVRRISAASQTHCNGITVSNLIATPSTGSTAKWYSVATGGTALLGSTLLSSGNYYVEELGSETSNRVAVAITVEFVAVPTVTQILSYSKDAVVSALTATSSSTGLLWFTVANGGTGSTTAPTPITTTFGSTTYWVSSTNANGCESARVSIQVKIVGPATNLNFDGVNDYVTIPSIIATGSSYTKEAMIKPNAITGIYNIISAEGSAFWIHNGYIKAGHTTALSDVFSPASSLLSTWNHVAVTYDASTTTMKLYVNGVMVSQNTSVPSSPGNSIQIGAYIATSFFNGGMDEVRVWNKALTAAEINRRKNCELQGSESGLIAYYKFNQGNANLDNSTQTSLTNSALNGTAGTLINFELNNANSNFSVGSTVTTGIAVPLSPTVNTPVNYVQGQTTTSLTATGSGLLWYSVATGGTSSGTALIPSATNAGTTSYWVSSTNANGCESERAEIKVIVVAPAPPTAKSPQVYAGTATIANLNAVGNNIKWYSTQTPGTALELTTPLIDGSTYYVSQFSGIVESATIPVTVRRISESSQTVCSGATIANLTVTPSTGATAKWFNVATGGTQLLESTVLTTGNYYVEQLGTETSNRILVTVVLEYSQVPTITTPVIYSSGDATIPLTATSGEVGLLWYTTASGGTGTATAPTPDSSIFGNTSYWVSSTKANGCESPRVEMVVRVVGPATNLKFDGIDDLVTIGSIIAPAASYTKEAMIKPNTVIGSYNILSSAGDVFWITNFGIRAGHANNFSLVSASAVPLFNTWNHVAVTYDAPSTTMKLYVNGVMVSQNTSAPASSGNTIQIGAYANAVLFNGGMDEVRIWNKALTADEINRRKNCELQGSETGLLAYYKFNQGEANLNNTSLTTLTDSSPNANTGTLTGFDLNGLTSNFSVGSPITTGIALPSVPTVTTPVIYDAGSTASPLTTNSGTDLLWYTVASGGTSSETAITPVTTTVGNTSYWVSSSNANGCESERAEIVVTINAVSVTITSQPANSTVIGGTNTDFAVVTDGTVLNYQWLVSYDGGTTFSDVVNGLLYNGATTATLSVNNAPISMNTYQYKVKVNNSEAVSNAATLSVTVPDFNNSRFWKNKGMAGFSAGAADNSFLALDANNTPYVAFKDDSNGDKTSVMKFDGTSWVLVGAAGFSDSNNVYSFSMAFDASNLPYVAYLNGNNSIEVKHFNGTSWTNVGASGLESEAEGLSLKMDDSGTPYVAFVDYDANYKTTVKKLVGNSWTTVGNAGFSAGESYDTSFAIDPQGTPYVVYRDDSNDGKANAMKFNGSTWVSVGPSSGFSPAVAFYPSLSIDRAGTLYTVFIDFNTDELVVMKFNGTEWVMVGTPGFASGVLYSSSIVLDGSGTPFVVYQDFDNSNKVTVKRFDGTSWITVGEPGFSMGAGNFTAIDLDSSGTPYVVFIDASLGNKVTVMKFNGSNVETIWENGSWDNGEPSFTMKAIIDDTLVLSSDLEASALEVTSNGSITVATGTVLTVSGEIINNNTPAHFVVEDQGILLQQQDVQNEGDITVNVNSFPLYRQDYTLWSSPVENQNLRNFSPQTLFNRFSTYNTALGTEGQYVQEIVTSDDLLNKTFEPASGYLIRMPNNWTQYVDAETPGVSYEGVFKGVPQNGNITLPLSTENVGANLVGNPYPSPISIPFLFDSNPDIERTIYFWRKRNGASGGGYGTYNDLGFSSPQDDVMDAVGTIYDDEALPSVINTGQGFFVKSTGATELNFNNDMRSLFHNGVFLKSTPIEKHRLWLTLSNASGSIGQTLVGYVSGATSGVDSGFDSSYFNDSATALTSLINGNEFAIQGLGLPFDVASSVALGFKTTTAATYSISLSNFDGLFAGEQDIFIKDNATGQLHNVKQSPYSFTASEGIANNRFELVYQDATLGTSNPNLSANAIFVAVKDQEIKINSGTVVMQKVELVDVAGRIIYVKENINASMTSIKHLPISNQLVIVRIATAEIGVVNKKIIF